MANKVLKTIGVVAKDTITTAAGATVGVTVTNYVINHDMMNDEETSLIVGVATGAATTVVAASLADLIITLGENLTLKAIDKVRTKVDSIKANKAIESTASESNEEGDEDDDFEE